jgi:hypothetical protein
MFLPSSVEFVGENGFGGFDSLYSLTFESRSYLRELLDVPSRLSGCVSIPDSIDNLSFHESPGDPAQALKSGVDSKLSEIRATSVLGTRQCQSCVHVSTRSLKHFRLKWRFEREASGVESD